MDPTVRASLDQRTAYEADRKQLADRTAANLADLSAAAYAALRARAVESIRTIGGEAIAAQLEEMGGPALDAEMLNQLDDLRAAGRLDLLKGADDEQTGT